MRGYSKWFTSRRVTHFMILFFASGLLLAPTTLALKWPLEWANHWRLPDSLRSGVAIAHAGLSFLMFTLLGWLGPIHIRLGLRQKRRRKGGLAMVAMLLLLGLSALGIYYLGDERLSSAASLVHLALGLVLTGAYFGHILSKA